MRPEELHAVALSICSSLTLNQIWELAPSYGPAELYEKLFKNNELTTQAFIQTNYPANPLDAAVEICNSCHLKKIKIITYWDTDYPKFLKEISKPPIVLYCKGNLHYEKAVAIVGTRKTDKKSSVVARRLSHELSRAGYTIVSGMAIGIDREAHLGALKNNSSTIGVLANGIDIVYPAYNRDIYSAISASTNSSLISEYPPGIFAGKWTFVRRNRIISGLALGTVVVKAAKRSGALITANYALEQNREVFVCPGPAFDEAYLGCNDLLKSGAVLVSQTEDILNELSDYKDKIDLIKRKTENKKTNKKIPDKGQDSPDLFKYNSDSVKQYPQNSIENKILNLLINGEMDIDSILRLPGHNPNEINEAIVMLELSNEITRDGNIISRL